MLEFRPNLILVIIDFKYESNKKIEESGTQVSNKGVPNEIRRAFLGEKRGSPNIPKKMQEMAGTTESIIFPIHFSLIKKPIKVGTRFRNTGVGAMILYEYFGLFQDLNDFLKDFDDFLKNKIFSKELDEKGKGKYSYSLSCSDYKIIVGKDWQEIRE